MHIYYHFCWLEDFTMEVFPMKFNDKETGRSFGNHCGTQFIFYPCFSDWEQNIFERNLWERIVWNLWSIFPPKTGPRLKNNKWGGRQFIVENNWLGQNQIQVNKFGSRLVLITGQPEPVFLSEEESLKENSSSPNSPLTYFCYRVKFCVKSYSMVGMIACEKKWSGSGLTVDQETKATFLATEFFRRKFFQRKYKNAVLGWNSLWVFDNLLASPRPPTWTNLRKMMRYWWTPSSPPPSAIWGFEVQDKLNDKNRKTKREYLFFCKQSF